MPSMPPEPSADPYRHLPQLRERIAPAEGSTLRVTPEILALWDARAREQNWASDWRLSDAQLEATRLALLGPWLDGRDLWVYGYGSLMWDPGFHFAEVRLAELQGYRRRFAHRTHLGRGSPECPGLMLTLEPGEGCCTGLAFRVEGALAAHESTLLWRREMIRGIYRPALLPVLTPQGPVQALVFGANPAHADHMGELSLQDTAAVIAAARGVLGSNREYLEQLLWQLEHLGIADPHLRELDACVRALGAGDAA
jgi:cation transport protein ChaC